MKTRLLTLSLFTLLAGSLHAQSQTPAPVWIGNVTTEHQKNPIGIGDLKPRLSWKMRSDTQGEKQTAYRIRAASSEATLTVGEADLWDSGKVASDQSVLVPWGGKALGSRSQVFWQVRVWDKDGKESPWSDPASFELGLLDPPTEWKANWITSELPRYDINKNAFSKAFWINGGSTATQPVGVRKIIELPVGVAVRSATIDINGDGLATLYVNGEATRQGSTSHTAPVHAEFGQQLKPGNNTIAISVTAPRAGRGATRSTVVASGVIELENGQRVTFNTDGTWKASIPPADAPAGRGRGAAAAAPVGPRWYDVAFDDTSWAMANVYEEYVAKPATSGSADATIGPGRYLRKGFTVKGPILKARLYSTSFGTYEAFINGQRVNDHQLDPGWTDYYKRVMVQTTDVTALLQTGNNVVGSLLTDGWSVGRVGWMGLYQYSRVGRVPMFSAQLEINYVDGSKDVITTDNTWKAGAGAVVGSDQQIGEVIDARAATAWDQPTFNDAAWVAATVIPTPQVPLVTDVGVPVRELLTLAPQKISKIGSVYIVDLGQNMVGHVRLKAAGPAGTTINVRHSEILNADGSLYTENLRTAISLDTFILKGGAAKETFEPRFTFHGFRYVEIAGYPGELTADDIRGVVVGSDMPATGTFESSSADLNQLYSNIIWGQRGNFISVPTDCPQRDERMGWMGDALVFAPTAAFNSDAAAFFTKWLTDVNDAQNEQGVFMRVSPHANQTGYWAVWGDAGVIIPWAMYQAYGDKSFLERSYPYMARWVVYSTNVSNNYIIAGSIGDHLAPVATSTPLVATAYYANSARIVAESAKILGRTEDAAAYSKLHSDIVAAFNTSFVGADGSVAAVGTGGRRGAAPAAPAPDDVGGAAPAAPARGPTTQTAAVLALHFNLLPEALRPLVAKRLADDVQQNSHLTTGFIGTGLLCPTLTQIGRSDLAWKLVFTDTYPSWLFSIRNGATTIWERWDSWVPERGTQSSAMNSFNHYSYGAIGYWFYSSAGGIKLDPGSPGYKHFFLEPQITDKLSHFKVTFNSPYGVIASSWRTEGGQFIYNTTVPPNSTARLTLPAAPADIQQVNLAPGDTKLATTASGKNTVIELPAGTYHFLLPLAAGSATATAGLWPTPPRAAPFFAANRAAY